MRTYFRQKWVWKRRCARCRTCALSYIRPLAETFDQFDPQPAARCHAHAIKEVLEREQIVCALEVKVMRALFSKDI